MSKRKEPSLKDVEHLLNEWCGYDSGYAGVFNRGLHLLQHLIGGGTLESYGKPPRLDPQPWILNSSGVFGVRGAKDGGSSSVGWYWSFAPRPEYEQDRTKYE